MNLIYFTPEAYKSLKKDLNSNESNYYSEEEWLEDYFQSVGIEEFYKESTITVPYVNLVCNSSDDDKIKNQDDLLNVKLLYSSYKDKITPVQAANPLLWSALCHITFKQYVLKRWKKGDGQVSIDRRFFATEGRTSLLYNNAVSRLWWSGYITYDEEKASTNPWHLTETLLSAQQIQKDLTDQSFSMNKTIVKGLLSALRIMQEDRGDACTTLFRKCCDSYINHYGAVSILDALSAEEICEIATNYMEQIKQ